MGMLVLGGVVLSYLLAVAVFYTVKKFTGLPRLANLPGAILTYAGGHMMTAWLTADMLRDDPVFASGMPNVSGLIPLAYFAASAAWYGIAMLTRHGIHVALGETKPKDGER